MLTSLIIILLLFIGCDSNQNNISKPEDLQILTSTNTPTITVIPKESGALRNPMKGLMVGAGILTNGRLKNNLESFYTSYPYTSMVKNYIGYNELDKNKIDIYTHVNWKGIDNYGYTVVPRVILTAIYHQAQNGADRSIYQDNRYNFWSNELENGDFDSPKFRSLITDLIIQMGKKWDNDNRITAIQMGIIGGYGEHSDPALRYINSDGSPTHSAMKEYGWDMSGMEKVLGDAYTDAFKNKTVEQNTPQTFTKYSNFGFYNDSIGYNQLWNQRAELAMVGQRTNGVINSTQHYQRFKDRWKKHINTGESALDLDGDVTVDSILSDDKYQDFYDRIYNSIRLTHLSGISWISEYNKDIADDLKVQKLQKVLGYRFVINSVKYPQQINNNTPFSIELNVTNTGSAPFYKDWKLKLILLDKQTKQEVHTKIFDNVDIRDWLPGDNFQFTTKLYKTPAKINSIKSQFTIENIKQGTYILALQISNPNSDGSTLRFATENYYNVNGKEYHPISYVGVDQIPNGTMSMEFDDPQIEGNRKLRYILD